MHNTFLSFKRMTTLFAGALILGGFCGCSDDPDPGQDPGVVPPIDPPEITEQTVTLTAAIEKKTFFVKGETADNFYMGLYCGTIKTVSTQQGEVIVPADAQSKLLYMDLYAQPAESAGKEQATLPEGVYTIANNQQPGSAYMEYTYGLWYFDQTIGYADPVSGTVRVAHTAGGGYRITAELEMKRSSDSEPLGKYKFVYEGSLDFPVDNPGDDEYPALTEPVQTTFLGADIKYLGIPAYSSPIDLYVIDLYDDATPLPDGTLDEGNVLRLELYTEHQGYYPNETGLKMPAGTYTMTDGHVPVAVGIGTGNLWDSGYGRFPYGSYLRHLDDATGKVFYGFLGEEGSVKVEYAEAEKSYTITVDLKTRQGVAIQGTYTGKVEIINEAQEPERQVQSRIYEDKVLDLANTTSAEVNFEGPSKNASTNFYHIFAQDPVSRQGFQLELLAPVGDKGRLAGTYKPSEVLIPLKMSPFTYIPGDIQLVTGGAAMIGTWGYYETNENGRASAFAPGMTGDIVVTEADGADGTVYTIEYVLTDDDPVEPHTMTAKFTGTFDITDKTAPSAAALLPAPAKAQAPVPHAARSLAPTGRKALRL